MLMRVEKSNSGHSSTLKTEEKEVRLIEEKFTLPKTILERLDEYGRENDFTKNQSLRVLLCIALNGNAG